MVPGGWCFSTASTHCSDYNEVSDGLVMEIRVWEAPGSGAALQSRSRTVQEPAAGEVVLEVLHCGLCHSDLSMIDNAWGLSAYPLVPGHEVVGRVVAVGDGVDPGLLGDVRGLGWISGSCSHCLQCLGGDANLCPSLEATIVGRQGGLPVMSRRVRTGRFPCRRVSLWPMPALCFVAASRCLLH